MQPQRLSYETAGAARQPRGEVPAAPRTPLLARVPAGLAAPLQYGRSPALTRQRRVIVATMVLAHGVAVLGLMNSSRLRDAVVDPKPVFMAVVETPATPAPSRPLPTPPTARVPQPPTLTLPIIALEQSVTPSPVVAQALPPPPAPAPAPEAPTTPAPSAVPKTIPASAVQYIVPPTPLYSRMSARMHESGKAVIRVWIDESGLPRNLQLAASTGFSRLDDAALAAVRNCRFKPYVENGVAVAGWAAIPIEFELPQ